MGQEFYSTHAYHSRPVILVEYAKNITFLGDIKIVFDTVVAVLRRDGISSETSATMEEFMGTMEEAEI